MLNRYTTPPDARIRSLSRGCGDVKKSHEVCQQKFKSEPFKLEKRTLKAICINKLWFSLEYRKMEIIHPKGS